MENSLLPPTPPTAGPLKGVKILDFTQFLAGPHGTQILGDLGADIIKIETPAGDLSRSVPPHFIRDDSAYFHTINRNKRSVVIDMKAPGGSDIVKELIATADVVVENFRPGVLSRLGINREEEMAANPALIWASISGFGQTGPDRDLPAYDMIVQALSGTMSMTGERGGHPVRTGIPVGDIAAGLHASIGILAALHGVKATGQGEYIDISMLDCLVSMLSYQGTYHLESGDVPGPQGSGHDAIPTYRQFTAGDGRDIVTTANTERMWQSMAKVLGLPELLEDPRFTLNADRLRNKHALWDIIEPAFEKRDAQEWVELFREAGIPVGLVNTLDLALTSPQVLHREMVVNLTDDQGNSVKTLGNPIKLDRNPRTNDSFPPVLGEHTTTILREVLNKSSSEIDELYNSGAIKSSDSTAPVL